MAQKIKFSFIKMFFRLFSFLADKTGGWKIFVQPKIMLGTMILGFGVVACGYSEKKTQTDRHILDIEKTETENLKSVKCYEGNITDSALLNPEFPPPLVLTQTLCYFTIPDIMCYVYETERLDTTIIEKNDTIITNESDTTIYNIADVDKKPEFYGGNDALKRWMDNNIEWPIEAMDAGVQGRVIVSFVVEKLGEISNIKIAKSMHPAFDRQAIRVIEKMPKWKPAEIDNKPVRCYFTLPVSFVLR